MTTHYSNVKAVDFKGQTFCISRVYNFICIDIDGSIWVYQNEPVKNKSGYVQAIGESEQLTAANGEYNRATMLKV